MPLQPIQLDDRTFEQLFAEARARIPVHTPEWTNFNESDPGITIIQLFAFMTENSALSQQSHSRGEPAQVSHAFGNWPATSDTGAGTGELQL